MSQSFCELVAAALSNKDSVESYLAESPELTGECIVAAVQDILSNRDLSSRQLLNALKRIWQLTPSDALAATIRGQVKGRPLDAALINLVLVAYRARPAYHGNCKEVDRLLALPSLKELAAKLTRYELGDKFCIVVRTDDPPADLTSLLQNPESSILLGRVLGYLCPRDVATSEVRHKTSYAYTMSFSIYRHTFPLWSFVCLEDSAGMRHAFNEQAAAVRELLINEIKLPGEVLADVSVNTVEERKARHAQQFARRGGMHTALEIRVTAKNLRQEVNALIDLAPTDIANIILVARGVRPACLTSGLARIDSMLTAAVQYPHFYNEILSRIDRYYVGADDYVFVPKGVVPKALTEMLALNKPKLDVPFPTEKQKQWIDLLADLLGYYCRLVEHYNDTYEFRVDYEFKSRSLPLWRFICPNYTASMYQKFDGQVVAARNVLINELGLPGNIVGTIWHSKPDTAKVLIYENKR